MPIRDRYEHGPVKGARVGRLNAGLTSTFIVYRIGATLIDCGPANQWRAVKEFIGADPISRLLLTHHHEDHSGNAYKISRKYNLTPLAPVQSTELLRNGFYIPIWQRVTWGRNRPVQTTPFPKQLALDDGTPVTPIHSPGHADDMTCLLIPSQGWLFTADAYIASRIKYFRYDEKLDQIMESLTRLLTLDFDTLFCAHRGISTEGKAVLTKKLSYLQQLCTDAQSLAAQGVADTDIRDKLLGPEGWFSTMSSYQLSKLNLIREALRLKI